MYYKEDGLKFISTLNLSKVLVPFNLAVIYCAYKAILFMSDEV